MIIVFGSGLYGKVDEVPQLWHVATRFGHLWYVPLIPLGSYLVFNQQGENFQGVPISLSLKSVFTAWLRAGSILAIIAIIPALIALKEGNVAAALSLSLIAIAAVATSVATYKVGWFRRASYERARQYGERAGLSGQGWLMLDVIYGRKTPVEADAELARIEQEEEVVTAKLAETKFRQ